MNAFSLVSGVQFVLDVENVSVQFLVASKVCIEASFGVWQWHNWLDMLPTILLYYYWMMYVPIQYITNITTISHSRFLTLNPRFSILMSQTSNVSTFVMQECHFKD